MSAKTGRAPAITIASAVKAADNGVVITSSPAPTAQRAEDERDRVRAVADADGVGGARCRGELLFEGVDLGTQDEPAARP